MPCGPAGGRPDRPLRAPRDRKLQHGDGADVCGHRIPDGPSRFRGRCDRAVQRADRIRSQTAVPHAPHCARGPATGVPEPDRPRDPSASQDRRRLPRVQDERPGGQGLHRGAVSCVAGRGPDRPSGPRILLPPTGYPRRERQHHRDVRRRSVLGTCADLLLPQRRERGDPDRQRGHDAAQPRPPGRAAVPDQGSQHPDRDPRPDPGRPPHGYREGAFDAAGWPVRAGRSDARPAGGGLPTVDGRTPRHLERVRRGPGSGVCRPGSCDASAKGPAVGARTGGALDSAPGTDDARGASQDPAARSPRMKVALIGDAHGNLHALEAVLRGIRRRRVDAIWNLGDAVGYGAFPEEVVVRLRQEGALSIAGNFDLRVLDADPRDPEAGRTSVDKWIAPVWAHENLSPSSLRYLASLPRERRLFAEGRKVLLIHGSPASNTERLEPTTSPDRLAELAAMARAELVLLGHSHMPFVRQAEGVTFVNPGGVGRSDDGDPRASYAVLDAQEGGVKVTHHRVTYDVRAAADALVGRGLPESFGRMLWEARPLDVVQQDPNGHLPGSSAAHARYLEEVLELA